MNKHYGQMTKTYTRAAVISALLLILCGILFYATDNVIVSTVQIIAGFLVLGSVIILKNQRKTNINAFLNQLAKGASSVSANLMSSFPIPVVVANIDGSINWYNEKFSELFFGRDLFETNVGDIISDVKWGEILKSSDAYEKNVEINDMKYQLIAKTIKNKHVTSAEDVDKVSVYIYLIDKTAEIQLRKMYNNDKTDIAIINIDNYEDVVQRATDIEQQYIITHIRQAVNEWALESNALVKNTDRDRYYVFFEHKHLANYISKKFEILYKVRKIGEDMKLPVSISIGIGAVSYTI